MITYKELSSITSELGFSAKALYSATNGEHYRKVQIPKKNGEVRLLYVPDEFLKAIQRAINEKILHYEEISPYATAYRFGGSIVKNAKPHLGKNMLLKLDIKHFFDGIIYPIVKEQVFRKEKYSEKNRILLTLLCTHKGCLPQGAPTSPIISNIVMKDFDNRVGKMCREMGITYTRYCDDMTFSGDFDPEKVIDFVKTDLYKMGFFLNDKKTKIVRSGQRKIVTGIVVNEKTAVIAEYKKSIRQAVFYCKKFGVKSHLEHCNIKDSETVFLRRLEGKINFALSAEPQNSEMREYKRWACEHIRSVKG